MIKFLIASHGHLADGFKSALEIIMGKEISNRISTINAFLEETNEDDKGNIERFVKNIPLTDKLIVFSDIMHGSVNQFLIPLIDDARIYLITGVNFPLICEIVAKYSFSDESEVDTNDLHMIVENAKNEIIYVNDHIKLFAVKDSENDFFE